MGECGVQTRCYFAVVDDDDDPCSDPAEKVVGVALDEEEVAGDAEGSEGPRQEQVGEGDPDKSLDHV